MPPKIKAWKSIPFGYRDVRVRHDEKNQQEKGDNRAADRERGTVGEPQMVIVEFTSKCLRDFAFCFQKSIK